MANPLPYDDLEPMSIRKFSRYVNLSDTTIRSYIADGIIKKGVNADKKIIPRYAKAELNIFVEGEVFTPKPLGGAPVKRPGEFGEEYGFDDDDLIGGEGDEEFDYSNGIPDNIPKREADRLNAVFRAKKAHKEYDEVAGKLIDKALVYETLFVFAQGMRDRLMNVPDRCIDDVLASDNRNLAIKRMADEIAEALTDLANTRDIKFLEKR